MRIRTIALLLMAVLVLPLASACAGDGGGAAAATTPGPTLTSEPTTPEPTEPPTTAAPTTPEPTTEAPTMPPIDPSLPYFEQMDLEFAFYGFTGGTDIVSADGEEAVMKKLNASGAGHKREAIDMAADPSAGKVPFKYAYRYTVSKQPANTWDCQATNSMLGDIKEGEVIVGVLWFRDGGGENPAIADLFIKNSPDWAVWNIDSVTVSTDSEWKKYYFAAQAPADMKGSNTQMQIFVGHQVQTIDIGGYYIKKYDESFATAAYKLPMNP